MQGSTERKTIGEFVAKIKQDRIHIKHDHDKLARELQTTIIRERTTHDLDEIEKQEPGLIKLLDEVNARDLLEEYRLGVWKQRLGQVDPIPKITKGPAFEVTTENGFRYQSSYIGTLSLRYPYATAYAGVRYEQTQGIDASIGGFAKLPWQSVWDEVALSISANKDTNSIHVSYSNSHFYNRDNLPDLVGMLYDELAPQTRVVQLNPNHIEITRSELRNTLIMTGVEVVHPLEIYSFGQRLIRKHNLSQPYRKVSFLRKILDTLLNE